MDPTRLNSGLRLHSLTMVKEGDGVMVGRPDTGSYALFPDEGAHILRLIQGGSSLTEAVSWYEQTSGSRLDVEDYLATLDDLGFVLTADEHPCLGTTVRWQRLGKVVYSRPALLAYAIVIGVALVLLRRDPLLRPSYRHLFFTTHISLIPLVITVCTVPCILLHEGSHALAGRRLGLPSRLSIGRRLFYLVAETRLDALLSVPRRARYLPFLAGMLTDTLVLSVLTIGAAVLRSADAPGWVSGVLLAVAFTCVLRLLWQFLFYLETDLYYVFSTALGCADLQNAARHIVGSRLRRLVGRGPRRSPEEFAPHDLRVARWYAPVLVSGYAFSLFTLCWAGLPTAVRIWSIAEQRIVHHASTGSTVDALAFLFIEAVPMALLGYVTLRDRRERRRPASKGAPS